MKRNYTIDAVKFIGAIFVVLIHSSAFMVSENVATFNNYYWWRPIMNTAVPFFFAASGYLVAHKPTQYLLDYAEKILYLLVLASLFYFMADSMLAIFDGVIGPESVFVTLGAYLTSIDLANLFNGSMISVHLWYLMATGVATIILYLLRRLDLTWQRIAIISIILYGVSLIPQVMTSAGLESLLLYGGFPKAIIYMVAGALVSRKEWPLHKYKYHLMVVGGVIYMWAAYYFQTTYTFTGEVAMLVFIYGLIAFCDAHPGTNRHFVKLGQLSMDIYILHYLLISIFGYFIPLLSFVSVDRPVIQTLLTGLFAIMGSIYLYPIYDRYFYQPVSQYIREKCQLICRFKESKMTKNGF